MRRGLCEIKSNLYANLIAADAVVIVVVVVLFHFVECGKEREWGSGAVSSSRTSFASQV